MNYLETLNKEKFFSYSEFWANFIPIFNTTLRTKLINWKKPKLTEASSINTWKFVRFTKRGIGLIASFGINVEKTIGGSLFQMTINSYVKTKANSDINLESAKKMREIFGNEIRHDALAILLEAKGDYKFKIGLGIHSPFRIEDLMQDLSKMQQIATQIASDMSPLLESEQMKIYLAELAKILKMPDCKR